MTTTLDHAELRELIARLREHYRGLDIHSEAADALTALLDKSEADDKEIERLRDVDAKRFALFQARNDEIAALTAERDRLREALEPFAKAADAYDPVENDDDHPAWMHRFTYGELRRARAALNPAPEREDKT